MDRFRRFLPFLVLIVLLINLGAGYLLISRLDVLDGRPTPTVATSQSKLPDDATASSTPVALFTLASSLTATAITEVVTASPSVIASATPLPPPRETPAAAIAPPPSPRPSPTLIPVAITSTIGYSAGDRPIVSYQFNNGPKKIVFIGGIHGGYEWNSILLAYEAIDHFRRYPGEVPGSVTMYIIPSANPDGQFRVTGRQGRFEPGDVISDTFPGRFNDKNVDLNRNWDCLWQPFASWRDQTVDAGDTPFSEPESIALRDFLLAQQPEAVVFWHSQADGVYGSGCPEVYEPALQLAQVYGLAANYPVHDIFDEYTVSGDAGDWLSTVGVPAVTVELTTHEGLEFPRNLAGMRAVLAEYAEDTEQ
ncbi:MAG: hypothetical protein JSW55_14770 [Chloroflexota bacterium]|nr:MAG: hypothetical protein JSW55_14770 [Chloroflexota bacterium]